MKRTKNKVVYIDDLTGVKIKYGGWKLTGLDNSREYHFQSLSNLLKALDTKATLFGLSEDDILPLW